MWFILNQLFTSGVDNYLNFSELILLSNCTRITREQSTGILQYFTVSYLTLWKKVHLTGWLCMLFFSICFVFPASWKLSRHTWQKKKVVSLSTLKILINTTQKYSYYTPKCIKIYICIIYTVKKYSIIMCDCWQLHQGRWRKGVLLAGSAAWVWVY